MSKAIRIHGRFCMMLVLAACGGGVGQTSGPQAPPQPFASAPQAASAASSALAPAASSGAPAVAGILAPPIEMKSPMASAIVADLQALGLDAKNLPPIEKLEPKVLRSVMKSLAKALGVRCGDCHQEGDFAAPTRRKRIAAHMWDEFAGKLAMADGSPLFCDSCHQGRIQLLDRHDKKALSKWMDANFVDKLQRKDGKSHECETCHHDMDMQFLSKWGQ
jgi:hypothetical protein